MNRVTKITRNCLEDLRDLFKDKIAKPNKALQRMRISRAAEH